jgi:hypothetical protein
MELMKTTMRTAVQMAGPTVQLLAGLIPMFHRLQESRSVVAAKRWVMLRIVTLHRMKIE